MPELIGMQDIDAHRCSDRLGPRRATADQLARCGGTKWETSFTCKLGHCRVGLMNGWIDGPELLAVAAESGEHITSRSLELWRYRGLLPRGQRDAAGRGGWHYPAASTEQLRRLLYWRKRARSHDLIRIALWVEGFEIDVDAVRHSLAEVSGSFWRSVMHELDGEDPAEALERLARRLASKRGRGGIPRVVRMSAAERTRACAAALAYGLNIESEIAKRTDDMVLFHRMLGLRSGHDGGLVDAMALDDAQALIPTIPSPAQLQAILEHAPPEELELARRITRMLIVWVPVVLPGLLESYGAKGVAMTAMADKMFKDIRPEFLVFSLTCLLFSLDTHDHELHELRAQLAELTPGAIASRHAAGGATGSTPRRDRQSSATRALRGGRRARRAQAAAEYRRSLAGTIRVGGSWDLIEDW